jgi:hypothetical protein
MSSAVTPTAKARKDVFNRQRVVGRQLHHAAGDARSKQPVRVAGVGPAQHVGRGL